MEIIFFGTPQFSASILEKLLEDKSTVVKAVVTQIDKPVGRKNQLQKPPVKVVAEKASIPVIQAKNTKELETELAKLEKVDFFVVVAFGMILNENILQMPKQSSVNIHTSILPKYRGASPIQESLLNGDSETGVAFMKMDKELDHGPIYKTVITPISEDETLTTLSDKLCDISSQHLVKVLNEISENATPEEQIHSNATFCRKIKKSDGKVNFNKSAKEIKNMVRAYTPWPSVYFEADGKKIQIIKADTTDEQIEAGQFIIEGKILKIGTAEGTLIPEVLKVEGKSETSVVNFLNGYKKLIQSINQKSACP